MKLYNDAKLVPSVRLDRYGTIRLVPTQHPVRRFGQMPGHRPHGFRMAAAVSRALIEPPDMMGCGARGERHRRWPLR